jgi:DNA-directed RNA polymerase subunit RPC12/RpoP
MATLIPIASYTLSHEAYLVKSYLESSGIDTYINDDIMGSQAYLAPTGGIKILVPSDQVIKAKHLLSEYVKKQLEIECPHCNSVDSQKIPWKVLSLKQKYYSVFKGDSHYVCGNCGEGFLVTS